MICSVCVCVCALWIKMLIPSIHPSFLFTEVFEELTVAVQEKDSLASELHVRHIAIEQLFKNCAKLPWLHISRAGVKASSSSTVEWGAGRWLLIGCWEETDEHFRLQNA